jgi:hypothetical protein
MDPENRTLSAALTMVADRGRPRGADAVWRDATAAAARPAQVKSRPRLAAAAVLVLVVGGGIAVFARPESASVVASDTAPFAAVLEGAEPIASSTRSIDVPSPPDVWIWEAADGAMVRAVVPVDGDLGLVATFAPGSEAEQRAIGSFVATIVPAGSVGSVSTVELRRGADVVLLASRSVDPVTYGDDVVIALTEAALTGAPSPAAFALRYQGPERAGPFTTGQSRGVGYIVDGVRVDVASTPDPYVADSVADLLTTLGRTEAGADRLVDVDGLTWLIFDSGSLTVAVASTEPGVASDVADRIALVPEPAWAVGTNRVEQVTTGATRTEG